MKKAILRNLLVLLLTAALLAGISFGLRDIAAANMEAEYLRKMQTLLPGSENFIEEPYSGEDSVIRSVHKGETGYVIETVTRGYADDITMLIGVANDGFVTGLVVWEMHETFGLGANALTDWQFLAQFLLTSGDVSIATSGADTFSGATGTSSDADICVDGITGATVTSKAIARCVNSAVGYVTGADAGSSATSWGG